MGKVISFGAARAKRGLEAEKPRSILEQRPTQQELTFEMDDERLEDIADIDPTLELEEADKELLRGVTVVAVETMHHVPPEVDHVNDLLFEQQDHLIAHATQELQAGNNTEEAYTILLAATNLSNYASERYTMVDIANTLGNLETARRSNVPLGDVANRELREFIENMSPEERPGGGAKVLSIGRKAETSSKEVAKAAIEQIRATLVGAPGIESEQVDAILALSERSNYDDLTEKDILNAFPDKLKPSIQAVLQYQEILRKYGYGEDQMPPDTGLIYVLATLTDEQRSKLAVAVNAHKREEQLVQEWRAKTMLEENVLTEEELPDVIAVLSELNGHLELIAATTSIKELNQKRGLMVEDQKALAKTAEDEPVFEFMEYRFGSEHIRTILSKKLETVMAALDARINALADQLEGTV